MKTQSGRGQNGFQEESSSFSVTVSAGNVGSQAAVTYTRGVDLSGSLQGAGGIGGLLARTDMGRLTVNDPLASAYYHADGNGNITALVTDLMDTNQVLVAKYLYDSYGNLLAESGPLAGANKYRFSSKEWDSQAGLYYYLYRFYDPNLQRWPNRDPLKEFGFNALESSATGENFIRRPSEVLQDVNLYVFLYNRPIDFLDPLGLVELQTKAEDPAGLWGTLGKVFGWFLGVQAAQDMAQCPEDACSSRSECDSCCKRAFEKGLGGLLLSGVAGGGWTWGIGIAGSSILYNKYETCLYKCQAHKD